MAEGEIGKRHDRESVDLAHLFAFGVNEHGAAQRGFEQAFADAILAPGLGLDGQWPPLLGPVRTSLRPVGDAPLAVLKKTLLPQDFVKGLDLPGRSVSNPPSLTRQMRRQPLPSG